MAPMGSLEGARRARRAMTLRLAAERESVVDAGREIARRGLSHGTTGNVSLRTSEGVLAKPSAVPYDAMRAEDVPLVALADGALLESPSGAKPTSELALHLAILRARDDVRAVAHGHPPHATAMAAAWRAIPPFLDEIVAFLGGGVDVAAYAPSGSRELGENAVKALGERGGVLLANHGAVGVGRSMREAIEALALVEEASRVFILSRGVGIPQPLPFDAQDRWRAAYAKGGRRW